VDAGESPPLTFPAPPAGRRAARVRRLGVDRLWARDPARAWWLVRVVGAPVLAWLGRGSVAYGVERIPVEGGVLVAANHFTALDPVLVGGLQPRGMHFFGKGQLFQRSLLTEAILWLGGIPVGHAADNRAALRHATDLLRGGRVVGIFVEGARQRSAEPGEAMPGAALLALRAGCPVVPCGVDTYGWSRAARRPCVAVFGEPVRLEGLPAGREGVDLGTSRIAEAVERAYREAVAANEAGRPRRLPDGSRRRGWRDAWGEAVTRGPRR
jgi:1-acyl-sn-glycerol-3-phosphate acyltransferase